MATQVVGIAASPRPIGNSTSLLEAVLNVARNKYLDVEEVHLNDLHYKGCQACLECSTSGRCEQADEAQEVIKELAEASVWVFASPIYFDGVSGQMKMFFDRLYSFANAKKKLPGKHRAALLVTYEAPRNEFYEEVARRMGNYFRWFGDFEMVEVLAVSMAGSSQPVRNRPELLAQAKSLGEKLFSGIPALQPALGA